MSDGPAGAVHRLRPETTLPGLGCLTILDFWSWAYSDILENVHRGYYAEFLVGAALGLLDVPRVGWTGYDFLYCGQRIEVKSSAYLQSWHKADSKPTSPNFNIAEKIQWDPDGGPVSAIPVRACECYVFCLFTARNRSTVDVFDARAWEFYVVPTSDVASEHKARKQLPLAMLQKMTTPVAWSALREEVDRVVGRTAAGP